MNKSLLSNLIALLLAVAGLLLPGTMGELVLSIGLFALSGAITNWLAIHMLFEKVPGFYGSGVIPSRFGEFKSGIRELVMEQFFNSDNVAKFFSLSGNGEDTPSMLDGVVKKLDFNHAFDGLTEVIMKSSFAGMLAMVGGAKALDPLREPFVSKMQDFLRQVSEDKEVLGQLGAHNSEALLKRVEAIVDKRLDELTPQLVKEIIQKMIKKHLGWLVVWGGVVGGLLGLLVNLMTRI